MRLRRRPAACISPLSSTFLRISVLSSALILPKSASNCMEQPPGWLKAFVWSVVGGLAPPYGGLPLIRRLPSRGSFGTLKPHNAFGGLRPSWTPS
eukprot:5648948-Alexandrium_andersonii.AAC.1